MIKPKIAPVFNNFGLNKLTFLTEFLYFCRFVPVAPYRARWKGLLYIFQVETWAAVGIMLIVSSVTWLIFGNLLPEAPAMRNMIECLLNTWAVFLGRRI